MVVGTVFLGLVTVKKGVVTVVKNGLIPTMTPRQLCLLLKFPSASIEPIQKWPFPTRPDGPSAVIAEPRRIGKEDFSCSFGENENIMFRN